MYLSPSALPCASRKKKESPLAQALLLLPRTKRGLLAQAARDVAEDVLDLVAEDDQDYDHDHRDQDEDKGVLDHTLPFLTVEQSAKLEIKVGQHASFTSLWSRSNRTQSHMRPRTDQRTRRKDFPKSFDESVTGARTLQTELRQRRIPRRSPAGVSG